ncbi:S-4TM family putative pore-forming effector [Actinocatenispora sera]|uniref:S-4TM family putative pore-forming effector n=1 Tax=Actinocatenispora sera TaxID=390989 RepID=UPI0033DAEC58
MTVPPSAPYMPPSSAEILARQDEDEALRLLIAQRRLYSRSKRWMGMRWVGMIVIGLAAPTVSVIWPRLAVVSGAVAGIWLFLGQSPFKLAQSATTNKAAAVQEQFDSYVFGMPAAVRSTAPSMEEIADIVGPTSEIRKSAQADQLLKWYPVDRANTGAVTVAIAQRANAAYSDRLIRTTALVWTVATTFWVLVLIIASLLAQLSLLIFLVGVFLPTLPTCLDVAQYTLGVWRSANERKELARTIEERLTAPGGVVEPNDLLVWQERMYELRRSTPQVPDFIYRIKRKVNESSMRVAASQLGNAAKKRR